jgi:hypothetical protein
MGLLEYQAMPSLRDVAHDGVLCTFSNTETGASGVVRQGWRHEPSTTYKITPCWVTLSPCWASPLVFGLTGEDLGASLKKSKRERPLAR